MVEFSWVVAKRKYLVQAIEGKPSPVLRIFRASPKKLEGQEVHPIYFSVHELTVLQRRAQFLLDSRGKKS